MELGKTRLTLWAEKKLVNRQEDKGESKSTIFTMWPASFRAAARDEESGPRRRDESLAGPFLAALMVLTAGLCLTFALYGWERRTSSSSFDQNFRSDASVRAHVIEDGFEKRLIEMDATRRFLDGSEEVTPTEFLGFVAPMLAQKTGISAIGWMARQPQLARDPSAGSLSIRLFEPANASAAMGEPIRDALERHLHGHPATGTGGFALILPQEAPLSRPDGRLVIARPTHRHTGPVLDHQISGYVFAVLDAPALLRFSIGRTSPIGLYSWVRARPSPGSTTLLASWEPRLTVPGSPFPGTDELLAATYEHSFSLLGLRILVRVSPAPSYVANHWKRLQFFIFPAGVLFTGLVTGLVVVLITQRRRAEKLVAERTHELSESEQKLRTIADFTVGWEYWVSETGQLLHVSPAVERVTGFTAQEFEADSDLIYRVVHPLDRKSFEDHMAAFHGGPEARVKWDELEFRIVTASGEERWISHLCRPVTDRSGSYRGRRVSNRDVTAAKLAEATLKEHDRLYRAMFESNNAVKLLVDPEDGRIVDANPLAAEFYGHSKEVLRERSILDLTALPASQASASLAAALRGERTARQFPHHTASGQIRDVEIHSGPVEIKGRRLLFSIIHDVTDRNRAEAELRLAAKVLESSGEAVLVTDASANIISVNRAFTEVTGYGPTDVLGKNPRILASGRHDRDFYMRMWTSLGKSGRFSGEIWNRRKNGEIYPEWLSISTVKDASGKITNYVAIFSDVSERKAAAERIEFLAHHDPLTGLLNRTLLAERLDQAMALARRNGRIVALLFLDLDRFKNVNDSLGHLTGDRLLQEVASRLKDCVRTTDTVARQGGDEFLVILADLSKPEGASLVTRKILERLAEPYDLEGVRLSSTVSAGVSLYPADGQDFETLLRKADTALYDAKESGRNTYRFFSDAMNATLLERIELETLMRRGLERGEFRLVYQPQFDIRTGRVTGTEALLRWNSPELGAVPPSRFIPVAEESGLILPLSEWVLFEACRQNREWQQEGILRAPVAVNISAVQFQRQNLMETVRGALEFSRIEASMLELELTESILIRDVLEAAETLRNLKRIGVRLAIDDFGTGYSSLGYLRRFQVDKLKIDQSFIREMTTHSNDASIVRAIIQLSKGLKLKTIAEGVETSEQLQLLLDEGCDEAQGYFFSRPIQPDEVALFFSRPSMEA